MKALDAGALATLVEDLRGLGHTTRAVRLCRAVSAELDEEAAWALPVGQRDTRLAALRVAQFGPRADCYVECPACGEGLEFDIDVAALAEAQPAPSGAAMVEEGRWRVRYRLPSSADLEFIGAITDGATARAALLSRCVEEISAIEGTARATVGDLPVATREALETEMSRRDPNGATTVALTCAGCGHAWTALFDIAGYLWRELEGEAARVLREVDALARAYGWSEAEILALSPQRRGAYLDLVGAW